ncbi:hypothetical protein GCM10022226_34250 [Sphaerisporangium flaviroseum]|uniref:Secreted protein n=1 Tax=Sphaerisporangium flaviroseum TaxID=509199 RepID=A0ABP7I6D6_9ACTN
MRKARLGFMAAAAVGVLLGSVLTATPANAHGTYAPSCVARDSTLPTISATNNCPYSAYLSIHMGGTPDTPCQYYAQGQKRTFYRVSPAYYQHVVLC